MKVRSLAPLSAAAMAFIAAPAFADANSLNDYFGPREISVGEAARGNARGAASIALNPAGLSLTRQIVFEGFGGFRDGDSAVPVNVAACDSTVPIPGCFYYRYFNASPDVAGMEVDRSVHEGGLTLSRAISSSIMVGLNSRYFDYNSGLMDGSDASGFAFDAGLMVAPSDRFSLGVTGYNLVVTDENAQYPMGVGAGISVRPTPNLSIGLDGLWNLDLPDDQTPGRYGVGAEFAVQSGDKQSAYPLRLGGIHDVALDTSYLTAGVGFISRQFGIDLGYRQALGDVDERLFVAGIRVFGPTVR